MLGTVLLRDPRGSRWDGAVEQGVVTTVERLERACSNGEVGVFEVTGETEVVTITELFRHGPKDRQVTARVFRRTGTHLHKHRPLPSVDELGRLNFTVRA